MLNLWAHWVGLLRMCSRTWRNSYLSPFPSNGHKQKPTIAPLSIYLRSQYTLFVKISPLFSIHWYILQYCSELPSSIAPQLQIRSDRTARHSTLSFNISPVLALVLVASAWTTIKFHLTFLFPSSHRHQQQHCLYGSIQYSAYTIFLWHDFASAMSGIFLLVHINSDL